MAMIRRLCSASVGLVLTATVSASQEPKPSFLSKEPITFKQVNVGSPFGRKLISSVRELANQQDLSFLAEYDIKFQGCHHISQWNEEANGDDDVRIMTKRLVRFRLCPSSSCQNDKSAGCKSKYGDYVVDMSTFLEAFLEARDEECEYYQDICANDCGDNGDDDCMQACYASYSLSYCVNNNNDDNEQLDPADYAECAEFDGNLGNNGNAHYIGPYCASQGGEINLGIFTDDSCTTFSSCGKKCFESTMGYELPYADDSIVSERCMKCSSSDDDQAYVRDICAGLYDLSGKCETKMSVDYPNESACSYIQGIKIIRDDGVIRTSAVKKSKGAAVCIGLFTTVAVLLGAYVYYLRTKLGRAKINLSASVGALT